MNMFGAFGGVLADWSTREPSASLLMFVTAVLLFSAVFLRLRRKPLGTSVGAGALSGGLVAVLVFVGAVGSFYFLLDSGYKAFAPVADSLAKGEHLLDEIRVTQKLWGAFITQTDMNVSHSRIRVHIQQVFAPGQPTRYVNNPIREAVEQESLAGFTGNVSIHRIDARMNTYIVEARYEYQVVNESEFQTNAHFQFPLAAQHVYQQVIVQVNGKEIKLPGRLSNYALEWDLDMRPHETAVVVVSYTARGMGSYYFSVPTRRAIRNFSLTMTVDSRDIRGSTSPTSTAIDYHSEGTEGGYRLIWKIDQAIMTPTLGIQFVSPPITDPSQGEAIQLLRYMPRGLMLFGIVFVLTLIICGTPVDLKKFVLLLGLFSTPFLAVMGFDLLRVNYLITWIVASLMVFLVFFRLYRGLARLPLVLASILLLLFMVGYPFAGFLETAPQRNSFDTAVQAGILLYVFGLALYTRVRKAIAG